MTKRPQLPTLYELGLAAPASITLRLPLLLSKKNNVVTRRRIRRRDGGPGKPVGSAYYAPAKATEVLRQEEAIRAAVHRQLGRAAVAWGPDVDIDVQLRWLVPQARLEVVLRAIPRVSAVRDHDLGNMLDTLLDALQGAAYRDDAQVAAVRLVKVGYSEGRAP